MDLSTFAQALLSSQNAAAERDPYRVLASVPSQIQWNPSQFNTGENIVGGLAKGFLGSLFGGMSNDFQAKQNDRITDTFFDIFRGGPLEKPQDMEMSVFSPLDRAAKLFALEKSIENQDAQQAIQNKLGSTVTEKYLDAIGKNPYAADRIDRAYGTALAKLTGTAPPPAEQVPTTKTVSPLENYLEQFQGDEVAARDAWKRDLEKPDRMLDRATSLRKELTGNKALTNFQEVANRYDVLQKAISDPSAVADVDFAVNVAKILDPTSVVRESEQGQILDSTSIPTQILGTLNKAIGGGQRLPEATRNSLIELAKRHYDTQKTAVDTLREQYSRLATEAGVKPEDVVVLPQAQTAKPVQPPASIPPGMKLQRNSKTGETRVVPQ